MIYDSISKDIFVFTLAIGVTIFLYFKWSFKYWERKGLPFLEPTIPLGNMENPVARKYSLGVLMKRFYDQLKSRGCRHGGIYIFSSPVYIPVDPEYVKNIMQNDFHHFVDRGGYYNERDDPLSAHLFAIGGQKWRRLRTKLTPTFSSGKMKQMFETLLQSSEQMIKVMNGFVEKNQAIDIKDVVARFTTDIIGLCAFGLKCNSFKNRDAKFRMHGKNIFAPHSKLKAIAHIFANANPKLGQALGITLLPRMSSKFFLGVIDETLRFREEYQVVRNDMLHLLIELNGNKNNRRECDDKTLTLEEIAAQALVFFLAGFETSSTTMSYCLYELSQNTEIQEKVRHEIEKVSSKYNGKFSYDSAAEMKYLEQVIDETLRKYPVLPFLNRRCVLDYKIPDTDITIEKGTLVFIPCLGLHRDPELFADPELFDPERFSEKNKKLIHPFSYLPFGGGPRACIGPRFGMMQTKIGIASLLKNYKFTLNSRTKVPLEMDPYTIFLTTKENILLNAEKVV